LTPHASGAWQKKIRGKIHYFGKWARRVNGKLVRIKDDGWKEALELYKTLADDLHAGRTPRVKSDALTLRDLCNRFLTAKQRKVSSAELGSRMFQEYRETTDLLIAAFGKDRLVDDLAADDFEALRAEMAKRWGPVRLGNMITRVKSVFKYGLDNALLERTPRFGSEFKKPDKAVLRRHRAQNGEKMLEAAELRRILAGLEGKEVETRRTDDSGKPETVMLKANPALRAMTLLGVNAGFGNHDVAALPLSAVDLEGGWIDYPRPKTGIPRRCPLWSETVAAIREALAVRPEPKDKKSDANILFLQPSGRRWVRNTEKSLTDNLTVHFGALMKELGVHRPTIGFYTLRHVFRTVADAARDPVAIDLIMGHSDPSMAGHYRERIEDSRLNVVAEHVRQWLFGEPPDGPAEPESKSLQISDPSYPSDPEEKPGGPEGAQRSQKSQARGVVADTRPAFRLFVG
jgi:integrase